jgi:hypothetical protein
MGVLNSQVLITAVVPTYRRPKLLRRAIRSILAQTYPHIRVCVYDNASGDETAEVMQQFQTKDSRVEYIRRPNNIGAFANFMDGANRVETPFFSFLSDDDLMLPNFYEDALNGFQRYPEAALSTLATFRPRPNGFVSAPVADWPEGLMLPPEAVFRILQDCDPGLQALLIRREIWREFGGFDEQTEPSSDVDFQLRVAMRLPIVVSRMIGAIGVFHSESTTVKTELATPWAGWPLVRLLADKFSQDTSLPPAVRQQATAILASHAKRILMTQGIMKSISSGRWEDAGRAADLLVQEYGQSRAARAIRSATVICRRLPGSRLFLRTLFGIRAAEKALLNLVMQWRFRSYSRFLLASTLAASTANLASAVPCAGAGGDAVAIPRGISAN